MQTPSPNSCCSQIVKKEKRNHTRQLVAQHITANDSAKAMGVLSKAE